MGGIIAGRTVRKTKKSIGDKMIKGGFYIKARCIQDSEIATAPPHVREIWDWLIKRMMYEDYKGLKRGQSIVTISDIQEGLKWYVGYRKVTYSKSQCENAMKHLRRAEMITTTKAGHGTLVTVCKYEYYQDIKNYESRDESRDESRGDAEMLPNQRERNIKEQEERKELKEKNIKKETRLEMQKKVDERGVALEAKILEQYPFEDFWEVYDKKVNKPKCIELWNKLSATDKENIMQHVSDYVASTRDKQYRKDPERYLRHRAWQNEIITDRKLIITNGKFNREAADAAVRAVTGDSSFSGWTNSSVASGR